MTEDRIDNVPDVVYGGESVKTVSEVDKITAKLIRLVAGDYDEQLGNMRKAIVSQWILARPQEYGTIKVEEAKTNMQKLSEMNERIERIVADGKIIKSRLK